MMGWGSFSSAVGSGGPPRAAMDPGLDGPGPPALGRFGGNGVPMGSAGELAPEGGYLPPLMLSSPSLRLHFSRSIHQHIGRVLRCGCVAGMRGRWYSSVSSWPSASQLHITA